MRKTPNPTVVTPSPPHNGFWMGMYKQKEGSFKLALTDRKHTHTTPTHVNRQTEKECGWGRLRKLQTGFKMFFSRSFVKGYERNTA